MVESNSALNLAEEVSESWEKSLETERNIVPFVDIYENDEEFVLKANLPGVEREDVHIKYTDKNLSIFGKTDYKSNSDKKFILKETNSGNFYRKFNLSDSIDDSKISAIYENGQLIVKLPKHDRIKPRTINIK